MAKQLLAGCLSVINNYEWLYLNERKKSTRILWFGEGVMGSEVVGLTSDGMVFAYFLVKFKGVVAETD